MRIEIFEPKLYAGDVADELAASIGEAVEEHGSCTIALSGGSTPGIVYRAMSMPPRASEIPWESIKLFLGDERWVPETDDRSNIRMVQETLLAHLQRQKPKIFPVFHDGISCEQSAIFYAKTLMNELVISGGVPIFDIMILGLGEDGHTASLFPGSSALNDVSTVTHAVKHPTDGTERVTLARHVILAARNIFFLVKGAGKADIVKTVIEGNNLVDTCPARLYIEAPDKVTWFLDSEAAAKLKQ